MRLEVLLPAFVVSLLSSYVIVYRVLEIRSDTVRWLTTLFMTVMLTWLGLRAFVGEIRPFYAAFALTFLYLLVQRRVRARRPESDLSEAVEAGE